MQSAVGPYGAKFAKRRSSPNTITGMLLLVGDHLLTLTRLVSGTRWTLRRLRRSLWLDESSKRIASLGFILELNFILINSPLYLSGLSFVFGHPLPISSWNRTYPSTTMLLLFILSLDQSPQHLVSFFVLNLHCALAFLATLGCLLCFCVDYHIPLTD